MVIIPRHHNIGLLNLYLSLTDHIKTTHVSVEIHILLVNLDVLVGVYSMGSHQESIELRLRVYLFDHVKDSHDHIMSTSSLASTKHHSNLKNHVSLKLTNLTLRGLLVLRSWPSF